MAQCDQHSLMLLETLRAEGRYKFLTKVYGLIKNWRGQLPNLLDIFRKEEIEWLLAESVKRSNQRDPLLLANFAIDSGYRDEPDLDEDGKPILRRTTLIHHAHKKHHSASTILNLFTMYNRFDLNYTDEDGYTHFHMACKYNCVDVVKKFLELGEDPNLVVEKTGDSPLHFALRVTHEEVLKLLLRSGASPNLANKDGTTPLHLISKIDTYYGLTDKFFEICRDRRQPVEINARDSKGNTPLNLALRHKSKKAIETLLRNGADPNLANEKGETPLHMIDTWTEAGLLKTFLDISDAVSRPVQVDARDNEGNAPLHLAAKCGLDDTIELLLTRGADPNSANEEGQTPLRWAVASARPTAVDLLLDRGADPSGFVFPAESHLAEARKERGVERFLLNFKLKLTSGLLDCVERLEKRGYELDRSDALMIMKFFAKYELFQKPSNPADGTLWYRAPMYTGEALTETKLKEGLSLQDLIRTRPHNAKRLMTCRDYYDFARSQVDLGLGLDRRRGAQEAWEDLCERATRGFFEFWALQPFLELIHYRLPIEMCEFIMYHLSNKDLYNICLAATPRSN